jgi:predicted HicB family RNase H-like nuclease
MNDIIQYKDFLASVHFSSEDEVFYGKVLGINDLISFEGSSVRELKKSFQEAIEDYLETCEQVGKEPNKTYKGTFNVRIPTQLHKEAAVFAAVNNLSLNDFVKTAIHYALLHKSEIKREVKA